jgi:hypothetical protein
MEGRTTDARGHTARPTDAARHPGPAHPRSWPAGHRPTRRAAHGGPPASAPAAPTAPDAPPPRAPDAPETAPPESDGPAAAAPAPLTPVPLDALRALVLRAYPEALPELVTGETLEALLASAERAVALRARLLAEAQRAVPPVSAGAPRRIAEAEAGRLSPLEKIARALGRERS